MVSPGSAGLLEKIEIPPINTLQTEGEPGEIKYTPKNPTGGYLTIVESPLARGLLGILMSFSKTDGNKDYIFYHNYLITAIGNSILEPILEFYLARSYQRSEDPRLYILKTDVVGIWPVASEVPLIPHEIKAGEYNQFKANLEDKKLDDVVKDMVTLIVGGNPEFKLVNGILVPKPNYANKLVL